MKDSTILLALGGLAVYLWVRKKPGSQVVPTVPASEQVDPNDLPPIEAPEQSENLYTAQGAYPHEMNHFYSNGQPGMGYWPPTGAHH